MANEIRLKGVFDDEVTKGLKALQREARKTGSSFNHSFGPAGTALGKVEKGVGGVGKALGHAGGQIKGFAGSIGLLAGGAGMLGLVGAVSSSIEKAKEFGEVVDRLNSVTGLSVETTSQLAGALSYFGVEGEAAIKVATMAEKNLGKMSVASAKGASSSEALAKAQADVRIATIKLHEIESNRNAKQSSIIAARQRLIDAERKLKDIESDRAKGTTSFDQFYAKYGLRLTDNTGKLKDFNQILLDSADYFNNKSIPAEKKAAAMAAIYGKQWGDLVEVFEQGSGKIKEAEAQAAKLGLTLSRDNVDDLLKLRDATRDWNQALGGLQVKIGIVLIPMLTKLSTKATEFVSKHGDEMVQAFKDGAKFAGELGGQIRDTVVPMIKTIGEVWKGLPEDVKKLFIGGIIANKTMKVLFDVSGTDIFKSLASGLIKGILGMNAGVVNINAAVVKGGGLGVDLGSAAGDLAGGAAVAAEGAGTIGLGAAAVGVAIVGAISTAINMGISSLTGSTNPFDPFNAFGGSGKDSGPVTVTDPKGGSLLTELYNAEKATPKRIGNAINPVLRELRHDVQAVRRAVLAPETISVSGLDRFVVNKTYAKATGGPVRAGVPYLVGERRPEIFVPETSGSIRNGIGGSAVGPLDVNVNVSAASSLVTPGFARDIAAQLGPIIALWMQRQGLLPRTGSPIRG